MRRTAHKDHKEKKLHFNIKFWILLFVVLIVLGWTGYFLFSFWGVKTSDPTGENGSRLYLLSSDTNDSEKTAYIIESGEGENRKISDVYLFLYNKTKAKSLTIYIPGWMCFGGMEEDLGNSISVSSFRYAGDFLQEGRGVEYAIWQLSQLLGIKFDNYVWISSEGMKEYESLYGNIYSVTDNLRDIYKVQEDDTLSEQFFRLQLLSSKYSSLTMYLKAGEIGNLNGKIYSNMGFGKAMQYLQNVDAQVRGSESYGIDLSFYKYSTEELSDNGGQVRYIDTDVFDATYRGFVSELIDRDLEKERVRVEVYNGSGVSGAAKQFGRKIENAGCDVVRYENAPNIIEKTTVYISDEEEFNDSLKVVSETLSKKFELVEGRPSFMTTGDIVIILGEDIKQMYSF